MLQNLAGFKQLNSYGLLHMYIYIYIYIYIFIFFIIFFYVNIVIALHVNTTVVNNYSPKGRFRAVFLFVTLTETDAQVKQGGETN